MLTKEQVIALAHAYGADEVGFTSMDRFEGAPPQMDPRFAMPRAKTMIVFGFRTFRGSLRGVEEGTFFGSYSTMCYGYINQNVLPWTSRRICQVIEDEGYEAMPIGYDFAYGAINTNTGRSWKNNETGYSVPVAPGLPRPDIYMSLRIAGFLAGLGEIGWSKVFLSRKFGPRVRLGCVMTDMEFEPDPIMPPGTLCNRCKACAKACPGHSISTEKSVKVHLAGYDVEWGELDEDGCNRAFVGAEQCKDGETGDYLAERTIMDASGNVVKKKKTYNTAFADDLTQYKPSAITPFYRKPATMYGTGQAICGGKGCVRACMMSLEARDVLENKFKNSFRRRPAWQIDWDEIRARDAAEDAD